MSATAPKPFAFVLMPFDAAFDDAYRLAIKPACIAAGAYAERVDEQIFQESILDRIYNQIAKADLLVADMTGRNPNVFYEVGYAHALGKVVILLTKTVDDIPFDLRHYHHIVYGGSLVDLKSELEARVTHFIQEIVTTASAGPIQVDVQDVPLGLNAQVVPVEAGDDRVVQITVRLRNTTPRFNDTVECQVTLVTPNAYDLVQFEPGEFTDTIKLDDGRLAHLHPTTLRILPGTWQSVEFHFTSTIDYIVGAIEPGYTIRVSTPRWRSEFPFIIRIASRYEMYSR